MGKEDLLGYRRRYDIFRHHAWAGTVLLSVLLALQLLIPSFPHYLFIPLCSILILYIFISLLYTFRYRAGLSAREGGDLTSRERSNMAAGTDKGYLKLEKKRVKAELKSSKKEHNR
jgi:hypothetical protein